MKINLLLILYIYQILIIFNILILSVRKYQQRVPCELLSGLANALLNDTIFEIVNVLMEIQHVTEKHLFQQRLQLINKHSSE
jgi:hypothetical protein